MKDAGSSSDTPEFLGWESLGSLLGHVRFVRDHHRKIRRVALCAGGALAALAPMLAEHFVQAEIRHFDYEDPEGATGLFLWRLSS
jgi:hypothetical protein